MSRKFKNKRIDVNEEIKLDISVGDILLTGKFKNKRIIVKTIGKDDLGQPTINGRSMLNFRIEKNLPKDKQSKETREGTDTVKKESTTITKSQLREMIREALQAQLSEQYEGDLDDPAITAGLPDVDYIAHECGKAVAKILSENGIKRVFGIAGAVKQLVKDRL